MGHSAEFVGVHAETHGRREDIMKPQDATEVLDCHDQWRFNHMRGEAGVRGILRVQAAPETTESDSNLRRIDVWKSEILARNSYPIEFLTIIITPLLH